MKRVYIRAYLKRNLGDDLFVKILTDRYQASFVSLCNPKYKYKKEFKNVKFYNFIIYSIFKLYEKVAIKINLKNKNLLEDYTIKKSEFMISIGGSIFIEQEGNLDDLYKVYRNSKSYYIIGANFGPYKTDKFKNYVENKIFKNATDVCFRDSNTYNLFKNNLKLRKAPDIVFSLDTKNIKITNSNKVIISVIYCNKKKLSKYKEIYEKKIIEIIKFLYQQNYQITLMSFCKSEGDECAINSIINVLKKDNLKVKKYFYRDNITEALNVIGDSSIIVGTRFHANILGMLMNKTIIPISYNEKTKNVLKDIKYKGKILEIETIKDFNPNNLTKEDLTYKQSVFPNKQQAEKHFEKLDKILKKK